MVDKESEKKVSPSEEEEKDEEDEDKSEEKEAKKSFREAIKSNFEAVTEVIQSLAESQKGVTETLKSVEERLKALEKPTDFPLKPSGTSGEDVGADVKTPDEYNANSVQAALDADGAEHGKDKNGLSMQVKAETSTQTPRPTAPVETINKSFSQDYNLVLKDARETGDLSLVARNILYTNKYYTPESEAW
jgi:hypothetical protein